MADSISLELRASDGATVYPCTLDGSQLAEAAMRWIYIVQKRARWTDSRSHLAALQDRAREDITRLGLSVPSCSEDAWLEIVIPYRSEAEAWAARILPWEFLLRAAAGRPDLVIVRHLRTGQATAPNPEWKKVLFVESAPGSFAGRYNFDSERWLVEGSLAPMRFQSLVNPTLAQLEQEVRRFRPQVVHLSALDRRTAESLAGASWPRDSAHADAVVLRGPTRGAAVGGQGLEGCDLVSPEALGQALRGVSLLGLNCYYSASRLAALAVAAGVDSAVGLQDVAADAVAERFFASFYQRLRESAGQALDAFAAAWQRLPPSEASHAGLVFWTGRYVTPSPRRKIKETAAKPLVIAPGEDAGERQALFIDVQPNREINYARLHNGGGLFHKFSLYKYEPRYAHGLKVEVSLHLEGSSFAYQATFDLAAAESVLDLAGAVNLPLTSALARSLRESVLTSLHVRVSYGGREIYVNTSRVTLLAVNEWRFDDPESARQLASFVLPGDPVIQRIIDAAQRVLTALEDDANAGFEGYQSSTEDPDAVHLQVRAIWSTIAFRGQLAYSNPPPVFTERSQRLRTPSDIYRARHGTCIDLALLMAACLEYVEIHPVIFLFRDHAFAGYWRSEADYRRYLEVELAPSTEAEEAGERGALEIDEVRRLIREGALVPLETVFLTERKSFAEAIEAGAENLNLGAGWEALVDIRRARASGITPLPIATASDARG